MNNWLVILSVVLLFGIAANCSAAHYFYDVGPGKMRVSFNPGAEGLSITYDGVSIVRDSSMWVHNPGWNFHYYGYPHMKDDVTVRSIDGGAEAIVPHRSEWFEGQQRFVVKNNSVSIELKYKLIKDVKDADMEYCFGKICAAPILGRSFKAVLQGDTPKEGVVPVRATEKDFGKTLLTPDPFRKMEIDSRIGKMTIEVSGSPEGISMMDYRLNQYESVDKAPIFWAGILGTHLEYGKDYTQTVTLTIDPPAGKPKEAVVTPNSESTVVERADVRAPFSGPVYVIPEPQDMKMTEGDFPINASTRIVVGESARQEDLRGAESFAEEMKLLYGFKPEIIRESQVGDAKSLILVGETSTNAMLASAASAPEAIGAPEKAEGYSVLITPEKALVIGHDRQGTYYGMQTLKQLVKTSLKGTAIQGCTIYDWPSLQFRGAHLFTGNEALPFHEKLIDRILARYKMNNLVLEVDQIKWKTDPGLAVDFSEDQKDIKTEIKYAHEHFMEVTPLLQSLGHCDWLFTNNKNRDIAETPSRPYAYCPSNPKVYDYVFKFYDEVIQLFDKPRYIHIGHDEVQEPGGFPKDDECKKRTPEQIFVDDTLKVREHLAKSGAKIMMWGDMMLSPGDAPDAHNAEGPEKAKWIRDRLPQDVAITDWHYAADKPENFKSLKIFMDEGHNTIAATWYTPENIEAFSKQAKNVGALGLLQTTWAGFNSNENNLKESFNQFSAMILAAEYAWNNGKTNLDQLPYKAEQEFRKQWYPQQIDVTPHKGVIVGSTSAYNVSLADNDNRAGWLGLGPQHDLSAVPTGEARMEGDLFQMGADNTQPSAVRLASSLDIDRSYPEKIEMAVNCSAKSLLFLQTCAWTDRSNRKVGAYKINYMDGSSVEIPLIYGVNTASWIDRRFLSGADMAWSGRTKDDERIMIRKLRWDNPNPEKIIKSIEFSSTRTEAGPILLSISGLE